MRFLHPDPSIIAAASRRWIGRARASRLWAIGLFGFACGLPLPLSGFTLRYWLSESGVSLQAIGLTASIGLAYTLKFLWAPLLDRVRPLPGLGRRRGWLLLIQPALALAALGLALGDPGGHPGRIALIAMLVAFLSASQDIVVDAWRIETYPPAAQGAALAAYVWGYRLAMLVAGAGVIGLAGPLGWHGALAVVAGLIGLAMEVTLAVGEPVAAAPSGGGFRDGVVGPLRDLVARPGAGLIIGFVLLFKLGEALAQTMVAPFYRAMGFDRAAVALATGVPALAAALLGAAAGGVLVARIGAARALLITGFVQMASMGLYFLLAVSHGDGRILLAKVVLEGFAEAMADAAFLSFLSGLCARRYTATQYALLSSLAALGLRTVAAGSGFVADTLGWLGFYGLAIFASVPAMLIMRVIIKRFPHAEPNLQI